MASRQLPRKDVESSEAVDVRGCEFVGGRGDEQQQAPVALESPDREDLYEETKCQLQLPRTAEGRGDDQQQAAVALESPGREDLQLDPPGVWYCFLSNNDYAALSAVTRDVSWHAVGLYIINSRKVAVAEGIGTNDDESDETESECSSQYL